MASASNAEAAMRLLTRRYGASPEALLGVLCPLLLPIHSLDKTVFVAPGQKHARATFTVKITEETLGVLTPGRTGKFVPAEYEGAESNWREIAKGRITSLNKGAGLAEGEVYIGFGGNEAPLTDALKQLSVASFLEIDQYGVAAKALSGLTEYYLAHHLRERGFLAVRMPEDMAQHLGTYKNYDFEIEKDGAVKKLEVKSLWGTDTRLARLIHSKTSKPAGDPKSWTRQQKANYYPTSSCKFKTQDIFAVSLFLRTGGISDFAFAVSVPRDKKAYGLPRSSKYPEHVGQNPQCSIGDGTWFATIDDVWKLL